MPLDRLAAWEALRQRLTLAREYLVSESEHDPEASRRILAERAVELARPLRAPPLGPALEVAAFTVGRETYAVETRYIQGVFRLEHLSLIPGAVSPIFGVTSWRGELLTIMDLRGLLNLPEEGLSELSHLIVLGESRARFGILADTIAELITIPVESLRRAPEGDGVRREYLRGVTGDAVILLDAAKLLLHHG